MYGYLGERTSHKQLDRTYCLQECVIVFGAWSTWTYDYAEYVTDLEIYNYCVYDDCIRHSHHKIVSFQ